jgi:hypothetical protein
MMENFKMPYVVAVVAPSTGPSPEQRTVMLAKLKILGTVAKRVNPELGRVVVEVMPHARDWDAKRKQYVIPWVRDFRRPHESVVLQSDELPAWCASPGPLVDYLTQMDPDEVWCLNSLGQTMLGTGPAAKLYREAQSRGLPHYKLWPSWVSYFDIEAPPAPNPQQPRKKERVLWNR